MQNCNFGARRSTSIAAGTDRCPARRGAVWAVAAVLGCLLFSPSPARAQKVDFDAARNKLVAEDIIGEGISNPRVVDAIRRTPRHEFTPFNQRHLAYYDMALPIGNGQTISPPFVVAYMTEQLDPQPDDKVLEIGTGSGYQAAVLSPLCREVYSIEIVEPLGRRAAGTLRRLKYDNVKTKIGDGYLGWPEHAPFDRIIVTCSPEKIPQPLIDQLAEGGRLVVPLGERYQQSLYLFVKKDGQLQEEKLLPTLFVPMTGRAESQREVLPDPLNPKIVNGTFEEVHQDSGKVVGWHYQRQMTVESGGAPEGENFVSFRNEDRGRGAHALQAFPIDGRKIHELTVSCHVKGENVTPGTAAEIACVMIIFYDENRKTVSEAVLDHWRGTFNWQFRQYRTRVPPTAREAIVRVGLMGATGTLWLDKLDLQVSRRSN